MADTQETYWILMGISDTILIILGIISIHQLYNTIHLDPTNASTRIRITFYCTCCIIANTLFYFTIIFPNLLLFGLFNLTIIANIFEVILIITCYHIFRTLSVAIIDTFFVKKKSKPKFIKIFHDAAEILILLTTPSLYIIAYMYSNFIFIRICYIFVSFIILIHGFVNLFILKIINNLLKNADNERVMALKTRFTCGILVTIAIIISSIAWIIVCIEGVLNESIWSHDTLISSILSSFLYIILTAALLIYYYDNNSRKIGSVCGVCCCESVEQPGEEHLLGSPVNIDKPHNFLFEKERMTGNGMRSNAIELSLEKTHSSRAHSNREGKAGNRATTFHAANNEEANDLHDDEKISMEISSDILNDNISGHLVVTPQGRHSDDNHQGREDKDIEESGNSVIGNVQVTNNIVGKKSSVSIKGGVHDTDGRI